LTVPSAEIFPLLCGCGQVLCKLGFVIRCIGDEAQEWMQDHKETAALSQRARELMVAHVHGAKVCPPIVAADPLPPT
jgi:hypothetical protein